MANFYMNHWNGERALTAAIYPAYSDSPWVIAIREQLRKNKTEYRGVVLPYVEPIANVLVVGAVCTYDKILVNDFLQINDSLKTDIRLGLTVADDFELSILKLDGNGWGDFLTSKKQADHVIISSVFDGEPGAPVLTGETRQSRNHHMLGAWHDAAKRAGARVITTYHRRDEIRPQSFAPPPGQESLYEQYKGRLFEANLPSDRGVLVRKGLLTSPQQK